MLGRLSFRRRRDSSSAKLRSEWTASRRTPPGRKKLAPAPGPLGQPAVYFECRSWKPFSGSAAAAAAEGRRARGERESTHRGRYTVLRDQADRCPVSLTPSPVRAPTKTRIDFPSPSPGASVLVDRSSSSSVFSRLRRISRFHFCCLDSFFRNKARKFCDFCHCRHVSE